MAKRQSFTVLSFGLTLLELLFTLAIFLILTSITIPGWHHFILRHQIDRGMNQLIQMIQLTRFEAITRAELIRLCGSGDLKTCDGDWQHGMIVVDATTGTLYRSAAVAFSDYHLLWRSSLGRNLSLSFTAEGLTEGQQGTFYLCPVHGDGINAQGLLVNRSGRLRVERAPVYAFCSHSS